MRISCGKGSRTRRSALFATAVAVLALGASSALAESQSGEQKDMRRVGHVDLQGRAAYHPDFINYPDGRVIAFVGTHSGDNGADAPKPNPLKPGSPVEANGTMIIDITNPMNPVEKFHIPGHAAGAQSQSNRMCLGSDLPGGISGHVYLMRNVQSGNAALSGYEVWDVTNVSAPVFVTSIRNLRNTHKPWWECKTGIAYLPGSKGPAWHAAMAPGPVDDHCRLEQSGGAGLPAHPRVAGWAIQRNRACAAVAAWSDLREGASQRDGPAGTRPRGDRQPSLPRVGRRGQWRAASSGQSKLLPSPYGTFVGDPDNPTNEQLEAPQTSILYMSPDQGGHTSMPVFGLMPKSYENFTEFKTRDIVLLASESTADRCQEAPHWSFVVDVTVENSKAASAGPPPLQALQNPWQGPMVLSTMSVDPRAGEKWPRGNYCTRGARFGVHSSEENFRNPYYGKLTFLAYFTGGVRAWDIREPQAPVEVAFYVPQSNALTEPDGYMTNNLEVDNRGYIIAVDRNGAGMDILELHGKARRSAGRVRVAPAATATTTTKKGRRKDSSAVSCLKEAALRPPFF